ncbi:MAG TPA: sensor histidine kinase, partial [Bacteroidia bacterium]|nr:sensor histidine kinase [Bacteroidia bacterium]
AGILFDNLIKNAIKHNSNGGQIKVEADKESFSISNTGAPPNVDTNKFFERFYKGNSADSLGLGLAIVKKICEVYSLPVTYLYDNGFHTLTINLKQSV